MTRLEDRQILVRDIEQACAEGARLAPTCALGGIDARTLRRWKAGDGLQQGDRRPKADRPVPSHALSEAERARIIEIANEPRFAETPPARIVPALADEGIYIASESSFHRVLRAHGQMNRRGRAQPPRTSRPPTTHIATRPGDVWCWDVTFLPAQIQGRWFYFYLILDLYGRKIVGFEVHDTDSAEHAAHLARRTALAEGVHAKPVRPVLHGDNGATLKATALPWSAYSMTMPIPMLRSSSSVDPRTQTPGLFISTITSARSATSSLSVSTVAGVGTGFPSSAMTVNRWPERASEMPILPLAFSKRNRIRSPRRTRTGSPCPSIRSPSVAAWYITSRPLSGGGPLRISCMLTHSPCQ